MSGTRHWLQCELCQTHFSAGSTYRCNKCGGILDVVYDYAEIRALGGRIFNRCKGQGKKGMWVYADVLPVELNQEVSLGEGGTPLVRSLRLGRILGIPNLYFKCEYQNPTGSFKDRQVALALAMANELGMKGCVTSSSGNVGASLSTYSARMGLRSLVMIPSSVPRCKLVQIMAHGAQVVSIDRASDDAQKYLSRAEAVVRIAQSRGWFPVVTARSVNPYAVEGAKTIAYEICEEFSWQAPDYIFLPIGGGGLTGSSYKGYSELRNIGLTGTIPRLVGAQPAGCSTVAKAVLGNTDRVLSVVPDTRISGVGAPMPYDADWALRSIKASGGSACEVPDDETLDMVRILAEEEGIFVEPAGAISVAAMRGWAHERKFKDDDVVVCYLTGSGFKDLEIHDAINTAKEILDIDVDSLGAIN